MSEERAEHVPLRIVPPYQPTLAERNHEALMQAVMDRYLDSTSPRLKRRLWNEYQRLHAQRTPEMVAHMERERGLR